MSTKIKRFQSFLFTSFLVLGIFNISLAQTKKPFTIVIDPGHGGRLPGGVAGGVLEKDIVLQVAQKLDNKIKKGKKGIRVLLTRNKDVHVDFKDRVGLANKSNADIFISLHCNTAPRKKHYYYRKKNGKRVRYYRWKENSAHGFESFVAGYERLDEQDPAIFENLEILKEDNYKEKYGDIDPRQPSNRILIKLSKNLYRSQSYLLARFVEKEFVKIGRKNRGVKEKGLIVLQRCASPGILLELGFITNSKERAYLSSQKGQNELVNGIYKAIINYKSYMENKDKSVSTF